MLCNRKTRTVFTKEEVGLRVKLEPTVEVNHNFCIYLVINNILC